MRLFVYAYYLFYVLSGGFRHYSFDFIFFKSISGQRVLTTPPIIFVVELLLMILALITLLLPLKKYVHLIFFLIIFLMDLFFQNQTSFMSCFILPHLFPLFFYLFLHFEKGEEQRNLILYAGMLMVAVGYISSFTSKMYSMWFNWSDMVIYSYILEFYNGFQVPSLISSALVSIKNQFFWKLADYSVLVFQFSFLLVFFQKKYFYYLTLFAVLFHLGILVSLGIGVVFYLYILFYAFILFASTNQLYSFLNINNRKIALIVFGVVATLFILLISSSFDVRFFNRLLPVSFFTYADYFYGIICIGIYIFSFYYWKKYNDFKVAGTTHITI